MTERISNAESGERAEAVLVEHVRRPSCAARLQRYGGNRPLRHILGSTRNFQAQVKSIRVRDRRS